MKENKVYLGDSVYAEWDGYQVILTTENSARGPSNIIYLEPELLETLYNKFYLPRVNPLKPGDF